MKENKILKWALIISIVIIANLFLNYTSSLIFNAPDQQTICSYAELNKKSLEINNRETCEAQSGIWERDYFIEKNRPVNGAVNATIANDKIVANNENTPGHCDLNTPCYKKFDELQKIYEKKVFVTLFLIGLLILIISFFIKKNHTLSSALAITAVLNFIIASVRYWQYSDKMLKVAILLVVLIILLAFAIKKFKD